MGSLVALQQAEPPGRTGLSTCFPLLAAVKPGQACRKSDVVLEIHFPYLEMVLGQFLFLSLILLNNSTQNFLSGDPRPPPLPPSLFFLLTLMASKLLLTRAAGVVGGCGGGGGCVSAWSLPQCPPTASHWCLPAPASSPRRRGSNRGCKSGRSRVIARLRSYRGLYEEIVKRLFPPEPPLISSGAKWQIASVMWTV